MSNLASLFFYLFSFSLAALLMHYGIKRNHKIIIVVSLFIPIIIAGFRYGIGTDYFSYISIYEQLSSLSFVEYLSIESNIEIGFYFLIKLSHLITSGPTFLFISSSFLTILFFYLGLKRYDLKHKALIYFLFLTLIFPSSFNNIRQSVAISICFFALSFIIKRIPKQYFLWILIASLFHGSALFLLPFYFINRLIKKGTNRLFLLKVGLFTLATCLILPYLYDLLQTIPFLNKYSTYQMITAEGNNNIFYLKVIILMGILLFYKRIISHNTMNMYFLIFFVLDIVLSTLGFISPFIKRIALYFALFSPLLLVAIPDMFSDKLGKFISYVILIIYGMLYFYLAFYVMGQSEIFPYQFALGGSL